MQWLLLSKAILRHGDMEMVPLLWQMAVAQKGMLGMLLPEAGPGCELVDTPACVTEAIIVCPAAPSAAMLPQLGAPPAQMGTPPAQVGAPPAQMGGACGWESTLIMRAVP